MSACNVDVIKFVGNYLNIPVGPVCYSTDRVLTTVLDKENVEGFASIVLRLASKSGSFTSQETTLQIYQWLEHISMYGNQAASSSTFATSFLQGINRALQKNTYLTGQFLTVADVAAYHVLYSIMERLSFTEREALLHLSRWYKHIQTQPRVCASRTPLQLGLLNLSILAPALH